MKVLMTADCIGGVWTYALELCRALSPHGVQVRLATLGRSLSREQRKAAAALEHVEVCESDYRLCWMEQPWEDVRRADDWLLDLAERFRPDIVHLNDYPHGALLWPAPVLMVGHSCVLSWWQAVQGGPAPASWRLYQQEVARGLQGADLVVAPSEAMLSMLRQYYGPLPRTRVIYNGRSDCAPGPKAPLILAAGRLWDAAKNIAILTRAAPRLPWPVYVAGEDEHPNGGREVFPNLHLLGRLSPAALRSWYARAALFAAPARYEPFGLAILEAGLAGCALVLSDIPSLRELWKGAALWVPADDDKALVEGLQTLCDDNALRARYAMLAQARARTFTPEAMGLAYLDAYRELLQIRAGVAAIEAGGS